MAGTINSLGIGSGVLTADIVDKLKANDKSMIITPLENKITLQKQKNDALDLLGSLLNTFKSGVNALEDDGLYQKRSVSGGNSSISVTADAGVAVQSFSIKDTQMALQNVQESGSFASDTEKVSSGSGTMTLTIDGTDYAIDYTAATTLSDLKESINAIAGEKVKATTLQVGANDFRLVLTSAQTGANQTITLADSATGSLNNTLLSYKKIESGAFTSPIDPVASGAGNLTIQMGGTSYTVAYDQTTSLENLRDLINFTTQSSVASIDQNNKLQLRSNVAGSTAALSLTDNGGFLDSRLTNTTAVSTIEEIQAARDATFKFNGISISRSSNEITDVITGVTINLLQESGSAAISISQDVQAISDEMGTFVQNYNTLTSELKNMTIANVEEGKIGIFNGDSSINAISREINRLITSVNDKGLSLTQFGIDLKQDGTMTFNSSAFVSKFNENTALSESFLSGGTTINSYGASVTVDGLFGSMKTLMTRYTGNNGILGMLTTGAKEELSALNDTKKRSQALLDARYEAMTARFIQYDSIISRLNNQFSSLQQQINMAVNGTNN